MFQKTSIRCLRISQHQKLTNGQGKTQKIGLVSQMRMGFIANGSWQIGRQGFAWWDQHNELDDSSIGFYAVFVLHLSPH